MNTTSLAIVLFYDHNIIVVVVDDLRVCDVVVARFWLDGATREVSLRSISIVGMMYRCEIYLELVHYLLKLGVVELLYRTIFERNRRRHDLESAQAV